MLQYQRLMDSEMVIHCIYQGMKYYSGSPNFCDILSRSLIKINYWVPAQKCFEMMKKCATFDGMASFPLEDAINHFVSLSRKRKMLSELLNPHASEITQKYRILQNLSTYSENAKRDDLSQLHKKKAEAILSESEQ